ncbi:hypothetical protein [Schlesneria sp. T3-172]|uniref:hypothetical protein n=1 Tax=Schlesneria sphaerica TaxID=3373610 RepID=UPI0037C9406B
MTQDEETSRAVGRNVMSYADPLETRMEEYRNVFPDGWAAMFLESAGQAVKIAPLAFNLVVDWQSAVYTAGMPIAIIDHVKGYHDGFSKSDEPNTEMLQILEGLIARLAREVPNLNGDAVLKQELVQMIIKLGIEQRQIVSEVRVEFDVDQAWNQYLGSDVYRLGLWGSQRICFIAMWNAYENFLIRVLKRVGNLQNLRANERPFFNLLQKEFERNIDLECWGSDDLKLAREVRNSLSHAGGGLIDKLVPLLEKSCVFSVTNERVNVYPAQVKWLLGILQTSAMTLIEQTIKLPRCH